MAPIEQVSIAVRIRRSMMLSVPENVDGQTVVRCIRGKHTLETSLTPTEEEEERQPERNVNEDTCGAGLATYVMETSTKTANEIQELASGRRAEKCAGLVDNLVRIVVQWE
jgi:hypothetical protein